MADLGITTNLNQRLDPDLLGFRELVSWPLDLGEKHMVCVRLFIVLPECQVRKPSGPVPPSCLDDRFAELGQLFVAQGLGDTDETFGGYASPCSDANWHTPLFTEHTVSLDEELGAVFADLGDPGLDKVSAVLEKERSRNCKDVGGVSIVLVRHRVNRDVVGRRGEEDVESEEVELNKRKAN
jgi:hypothetical protein